MTQRTEALPRGGGDPGHARRCRRCPPAAPDAAGVPPARRPRRRAGPDLPHGCARRWCARRRAWCRCRRSAASSTWPRSSPATPWPSSRAPRRGTVTVKDVADELDLEHSTVSRLLGEMEDDGLVTRGADPADRRRTTVALTDLGRAVVADATTMTRFFTRLMLSEWPREDVEPLAGCSCAASPTRCTATLDDAAGAGDAEFAARTRRWRSSWRRSSPRPRRLRGRRRPASSAYPRAGGVRELDVEAVEQRALERVELGLGRDRLAHDAQREPRRSSPCEPASRRGGGCGSSTSRRVVEGSLRGDQRPGRRDLGLRGRGCRAPPATTSLGSRPWLRSSCPRARRDRPDDACRALHVGLGVGGVVDERDVLEPVEHLRRDVVLDAAAARAPWPSWPRVRGADASCGRQIARATSTGSASGTSSADDPGVGPSADVRRGQGHACLEVDRDDVGDDDVVDLGRERRRRCRALL